VKNVLIGGIGSVLLGDDGVGPYVARLLAAQYEFEPGIDVLDLGTPALELADHIEGRDAVILIDAVDVDAAAGTVQLYRKSDVLQQSPGVRMDPHSPALVDALHAAELFGSGPREVLLLGVVGASYEPGCELSREVQSAVPVLIGKILDELRRLGVVWSARPVPKHSGIWWSQAPDLHQPAPG
jgi:hydrogenase maturation protease